MTMLQAALDLAKFGWRVLPLRGKQPIQMGWQHLASADPAEIQKFFPDGTDYNVGVAMGRASGIVDFEADDEHGLALIAEFFGGQIPQTVTYFSSRGKHHLFRWRPGLPDQANVPLEGADLKLGNGARVGSQCVFPPSKHDTNSLGYRWENDPWSTLVAEIPDHVVQQVNAVAQSRKTAKSSPLLDFDVDAGEFLKGCRDNAILHHAGVGFAKLGSVDDISHRMVLHDMRALNQERCKPPLEDWQVLKCVNSCRKMKTEELEKAQQNTTIARFEAMQQAVQAPEMDDKAFAEEYGFSPTRTRLDAIPDDILDEDLRLWKGFLYRGSITALIGNPKAGKTTLLTRVLELATTGGGAIGTEIKPMKILYVTEESKEIWKTRRLETNDDNLDMMFNPFLETQVTPLSWIGFCRYVAELVKLEKYDLVVLDPWVNLSPAEDENNATQVKDALKPTRMISEAGAALLLVHHSGKSDKGEVAMSGRGSTSLNGFVDVLMRLRKVDPQDYTNKNRKIDADGRFSDIVPCMELSFDLTDYTLVDTIEDRSEDSLEQSILTKLVGEPKTVPDVAKDLARQSIIRYLLGKMVVAGAVFETEEGFVRNPDYVAPVSVMSRFRDYTEPVEDFWTTEAAKYPELYLTREPDPEPDRPSSPRPARVFKDYSTFVNPFIDTFVRPSIPTNPWNATPVKLHDVMRL